MKATFNEIIEIEQTLALLQHIIDKREWNRGNEVFTDDAAYDCGIFGYEPATGVKEIEKMFEAGEHAKAHHTTNTYIYKSSYEEFIAESKVLGLMKDGSVASITYTDKFKETASGFRLTSRVLKF